ncbi:MAG: CRISPR-associated endonuclease Cas1 [Halanaerobiales bacterium]|nr:CRISPR-associated endonuclease Cas1 [Halanaerobiales bacterium]
MDIIGASALNSFVYCQKLFYYREVEHIEAENHYLVDGQIKHKRIDGETSSVNIEGNKIFSFSLKSDILGIAARFDVLEMDGEQYIPVEYKRGKMGDWLNHRVQLCAQALLIEENYNQTVDYGYIYYYGSKKRVMVEFDEILRTQTLTAISEARQMIEESRCPETEYSQKCEGCSLKEQCLPEEVDQIHQKKANRKGRVMPVLDEREVLYITTNDVEISKKYNRLIIKEEEKVIKEVPIIKIRKVVLLGRVNLSHPVIALLLKNNIEVVYLNYYGKYEGTLIPSTNKNGILRKKQILLSEDEEFCKNLSCQFIKGKIYNMRVLLQKRNQAKKDEETAKAIKNLKNILKKLEDSESIDSLRGLEGYATKLYFQSIDSLLSGEIHFKKRNRRPPKDPVNALLSLGYTLLTRDIEGYCRVVGLDPYIGFLHKDRYGKPSLALDLMEEFRPLIVDQMVLYVLNSGIIAEEDFEEIGQLKLKQPAFKKFLSHYEQRKKTELKHPVFNYQITYQRAFEIQARMLAKYITGELEEYIPLQIRW